MASFGSNSQDLGDPLMSTQAAIPETRSTRVENLTRTENSTVYDLSQRFFFDAAHTLHRTIEAEGSRRIHGHTYEAEVTVRGCPDTHSGMVVDLGHLRRHIESVREQLDHHLLDEVPDLGPATLENLCKYIFTKLVNLLPQVVAVSVERHASGDKCILRKSEHAPRTGGNTVTTELSIASHSTL